MEEEIWKDIPWYEWDYQVSNLWRVKSFMVYSEWKIMKPLPKRRWYFDVQLYWKKNIRIHRLVAAAFLWLNLEWKWFNSESLLVCHKDDNPANNRLDNLFIWYPKDNTKDMCNKWRKFLKYVPIKQYSLEWIFIKDWSSAQEAEKYIDVWSWNIPACCKWRLLSTGWFKWKYA